MSLTCACDCLLAVRDGQPQGYEGYCDDYFCDDWDPSRYEEPNYASKFPGGDGFVVSMKSPCGGFEDVRRTIAWISLSWYLPCTVEDQYMVKEEEKSEDEESEEVEESEEDKESQDDEESEEDEDGV